jgi:hypothetical protein
LIFPVEYPVQSALELEVLEGIQPDPTMPEEKDGSTMTMTVSMSTKDM